VKKTILTLLILFISTTYSQSKSEETKKYQDSIIEEYLNNCAKNFNYNYQMDKWQDCLDQGLKKDSTIAYLWQQKAMPYFKARKYEVGMEYIDKAVKFDPERWQSYRAFIKCIFAKTYKESIIDFEDCKKKYGNQYVMDHTYDFYIGLCYLQLNKYNISEKLFKEYIDDMFFNRGKLEHPTALFYYGISLYEQKKYNEAIEAFDKALKVYPNFSDVKYYKAICLSKIGKKEDVRKFLDESETDFKIGYTINEDNTIYETYPYQKKWNK
jgi:tetratricopeptide (TPR) repeat protein